MGSHGARENLGRTPHHLGYASDSNPEPEAGDGQHVEELQLQCTHCPNKFHPEGCFSHVCAFGNTVVQHFCEMSKNSQRAQLL